MAVLHVLVYNACTMIRFHIMALGASFTEYQTYSVPLKSKYEAGVRESNQVESQVSFGGD
jgi:hypothetical protein